MIVRDVQIGNCRVPSCAVKAHCKGYCESHYRRYKKYGDPIAGKTPNGQPVAFLKAIPETDDCIEWPYYVSDGGYGQVRFEGKMMNAHRAALIIHGGQGDPEGMHAAHAPQICHNRLCVNPRHLRWATPKENMQDRSIDGTSPRLCGEKHGRAILTEACVSSIRQSDKSQKELAADYGVSKQTISGIIRRQRWSHV